jgi:hypothetical protein
MVHGGEFRHGVYPYKGFSTNSVGFLSVHVLKSPACRIAAFEGKKVG